MGSDATALPVCETEPPTTLTEEAWEEPNGTITQVSACGLAPPAMTKNTTHFTGAEMPTLIDPGRALAEAIDALRRAEEDFAAVRLDHKTRMENLRGVVRRMTQEIITGQKPLPLN